MWLLIQVYTLHRRFVQDYISDDATDLSEFLIVWIVTEIII